MTPEDVVATADAAAMMAQALLDAIKVAIEKDADAAIAVQQQYRAAASGPTLIE